MSLLNKSSMIPYPPLLMPTGPGMSFSKSELAEFNQAMHLYIDKLKLDQIVYIIPTAIGAVFDKKGRLLQAAQTLCEQIRMHVYVHYDKVKGYYRIGAIYDMEDLAETAKASFCYQATPKETENMLPDATEQIDHFVSRLVEQGDPRVQGLKLSKPKMATESTNGEAAMPEIQKSTRSMSDEAAIPKTQSTNGKVAKPKTNDEKVPKPRNCWIIYRQEKHIEYAARHPELPVSELSKLIAAAWAVEPTEVRDHYARLAEEEKALHKSTYPDYKCTPRKSSAIKRRKTKKTVSITVAGQASIEQLPIPPHIVYNNEANIWANTSNYLYAAGDFNEESMLMTQEQLDGNAPVFSATHFPAADQEFFQPNVVEAQGNAYNDNLDYTDYDSLLRPLRRRRIVNLRPLRIPAIEDLAKKKFHEFRLTFRK